jgi:predicted O-methyltransferase YrrM
VDFYRTGIERFGDQWTHADLNTVLYAICRKINVASYMEIGVRRGRSMAIVAATRPHAKLVGFDLWIKDYAGVENPGPDFVRNELTRVGHQGPLELITGPSGHTVPKFFKDHPDEFFDVITVDGDHSARGAELDLRNVIGRVKIGGFLLFDDLVNPWHPYLERSWSRIIGTNPQFRTHVFTEVGYGVAFAVRIY